MVNKSIAIDQSIAECRLVDRAWFCIELTRYLKRTFFNQYHRMYIKIIHQLVGHVYSLVHLAMADHRQAKQIREGVIICFPIVTWQLWFRRNRHFAFYSICESLTLAMVLCICTCDTQLWHFVLVTLLPTGRSRVSNKFPSWSQSKTSWPPLQ